MQLSIYKYTNLCRSIRLSKHVNFKKSANMDGFFHLYVQKHENNKAFYCVRVWEGGGQSSRRLAAFLYFNINFSSSYLNFPSKCRGRHPETCKALTYSIGGSWTKPPEPWRKFHFFTKNIVRFLRISINL